MRCGRLEAVHVRGDVAGLLEVRLACKVDHRRRATHEDHRLLGRFGQVRLDHLLVNEANRVLPWLLFWLHVKGVPHLQAMPFVTVSVSASISVHSVCTQCALRVHSRALGLHSDGNHRSAAHRHTRILCELVEEIQSGSNQGAFTVTRGSFASSSRRSLQRMSSTVRLAKRIEIFRLRALLATSAWHVWSTGMMTDDEAH